MNNKILLLAALLEFNCHAAPHPNSATQPLDFIPANYVVFGKAVGDLNKDQRDDYLFVVKGTDKAAVIQDEQRGTLDRNRRGIIIALRHDDHFDLVVKNLQCFSSENEDGGVYFAPELSVDIVKGNLEIGYGYGRYGFWSYKFRFQHAKFELIGYDRSEDRGPVVESTVSINFSTRKMLTQENTNPHAEGGDEVFKDTWTTIRRDRYIDLQQVQDFDELSSETLLSMVNRTK